MFVALGPCKVHEGPCWQIKFTKSSVKPQHRRIHVMKQTCLLYTHEKTISVVLEWPVWCCSSYTKQKVFDDDTPFCLEVPKFLHPALKQKGVFMELDIYEASLQPASASAFSIHYLQSI